jgi:hypothetical protein
MRYKSFIPSGIIPDGVKTNNMKKKKTAVQWLAEQLIPDAMRMFDAKTCNAIEEALQMEREQIQDAFYHGVDIDAFNVHNKWTEAEKYYGEKFGEKFGGQDE